MNRHKRKKKIRPIDEAQLWLIAKRLKEMSECPHSKQVESILVLLLKLRERLGTVSVLPVLRELNPLVRRYEWFNQIAVGSDVRVGVRAVPEDLTEGDFWERGAVWALLELVKHSDGLSRIKRCEVCNAWIFAEGRKDQEFCGSVCRQKHYDSDPKRRSEHRAAMRRLYALKKELAQNPKSGVGLEQSRQKAKKQTGSEGIMGRAERDRITVPKPDAYTVDEVAAMTGFSRRTVIRLFEAERGVIILTRPFTNRKRRYRSIRIPRTVYKRVIGRLSVK